jgi:hypothetical protein
MTYLGPNDLNAHNIYKGKQQSSKDVSGIGDGVSFDKILANKMDASHDKTDIESINVINKAVSMGFDKFEASESLRVGDPSKYLKQKLQNRVAKFTVDGFRKTGQLYGNAGG